MKAGEAAGLWFAGAGRADARQVPGLQAWQPAPFRSRLKLYHSVEFKWTRTSADPQWRWQESVTAVVGAVCKKVGPNARDHAAFFQVNGGHWVYLSDDMDGIWSIPAGVRAFQDLAAGRGVWRSDGWWETPAPRWEWQESAWDAWLALQVLEAAP
ncbi:MAG TPA: hypothetical protein EYF98_07435 [Planctomycetes bacterium]|jgi:hypothetical protein|nr:hypothetical protein [Planctomycetota bacterium]